MRKIFRHHLLLCLLAIAAGAALAQNGPIGACGDDIGIGFGLCNAYCDATDCDCGYDPDCEPQASAVGCRNIYISYTFVTGTALTCGDVCPCIDVNGWPSSSAGNLWIALATGDLDAAVCSDSGNQITLTSGLGAPGPVSARVTLTEGGGSCSLFDPVVPDLGFQPFSVALTPAQAELCAGLLRARGGDLCG